MLASLEYFQAVFTIILSINLFASNIPGVSKNIIWVWSFTKIPFNTDLVVCFLWVTIETFSPIILFIKVDFPTFGEPIKDTNPVNCVSLFEIF